MIYEEEDKDIKVEFIGEKLSKDLKAYKVIILGWYGVGKTSIINKLINGEVDIEYEPTMSLDVKNFQIKVNDKIIQINFWDCCGNDKYAQGIPNLFKNTSIAILVYAINDKNNSFQDLENWYNMIAEYSLDTSIVLIGNKNDLEKEREVSIEEAEQFRNKYDNIKIFLETSALSGKNIDKLLEKIGILIYKKNKNDENKLDKVMKGRITLNKEDYTKKGKKKKKKFC